MKSLLLFSAAGPALVLAALPVWAQTSTVVINEIHYDEDDPTVHSEFVELHNPTGADPVDLSGWYFSDGVPLVFPPGTSLAGGAYLIVCEDPATIQTKWGVSGAGVFNWNQGVVPPVFGRLNNSGGTITLRSATGAKMDEVDYASGFPWPTVGDPPNFSIELINPALDNSLGGSWRRSDGGTDVSPARSFVSLGSAGWHYRKALSEPSTPSTAWRTPEFVEDETWLTSANGAPFGYGLAVDTTLPDMRMTVTNAGYSGIYLRHTFEMNAPAPGVLKLRVFNDDGFVAWLNGQEIGRFGPLAGNEVPFTEVAGRVHASTIVDLITLSAPNSLLNIGTPAQPAKNVLCIHALNTALSDADFFINAELKFDGNTPAGKPTPLAVNSAFAANAAPAIRQVEHSPTAPGPPPEWPRAGQEVRITAKITDPNGVASASLAYEIVEPGDFITTDDARYEAPASWVMLAMRDDGLNGDQVAGDAVFSALIPAGVQTHRRLIRYRLTATDGLGAVARAPYADDPQPNFAYFVYDGVPPYTGKPKPALAEVTYPSALLATLPAYHLITRVEEHANAMDVPVTRADGTTLNPTAGAYTHSLYNWRGALCYDGHVYDHIRFRARGGVWRFAMGKNMWKFDFNKGHDFQARDNYGKKYDQKWKKLNFSACIQQGDFNHRGEQGLFESVGFRLFQLSGMPAEHTQFVHFRIIERPSETNATNPTPSQFDDDFQGLYVGIEQQDGQFLDEHGLPDGNLYKMESGTGELNNQGPTQPKNKTDLNSFIAYGTTETWWRTNCDLPNYYNYRAIVDCIHHYDIGDGKNYFFYHNPQTNKWTALPWDLDLIWSDNMYRADTGIEGLSPGSGNSTEPFFSRVFGPTQTGNGPIPVLRTEMRNRFREVLDLLFTPEQTGLLINEMASFIYQPGLPSFVDADRAMWDYNPIMVSGFVNSSKAGQGRFYTSAVNDPATPESELASFPGMMVKMKNYIATRRTIITDRVLTAAEEALVPATPTVTRTGSGDIPTNALNFSTSAFAGNNGATFSALKWRIAEVTDPATPGYLPFSHVERRFYEAESTWESPELTTFNAGITIPAAGARPGATCRVRVKHKDSTGRWSHWSAPVQFVAAEPDVSVYLQSLVVSQFLYNPAPPTSQEAAVALDSDDYEWIELMNVGANTLDLTPVRFTKGIDFDFATSSVTSLAPGERVLVVKNLAAFTARYGVPPAGALMAGAWQPGDSLSNGGEEIKLSFGAGTAIRDFVYDDAGPWPDGADGTGYGLVLINPSLLPVLDHAAPESWRLSAQRLGTPGGSDRISYATWAAGFGAIAAGDDTDGDGYSNFAEYTLASSPLLHSSVPALSASLESVAGAHYLSLSFRRRLGADDALCKPQVSSDLRAWDDREVAVTLISAQPNEDGTATLVYRSQTPVESQPVAFVRLKISPPSDP